MYNGKKLSLSLFGESHGMCVGINIEGLPCGTFLDMGYIKSVMARRRPGQDSMSTKRNEADDVKILSGVKDGYTTGGTLCAIIENQDTKSNDYTINENKARPSHADYTASVTYNGFNDSNGGGGFSGRLTAPIVFAGAVANMILEQRGINIGARIKSVGNVLDRELDTTLIDQGFLTGLKNMPIPVVDIKKAQEIEDFVVEAKNNLDSVGGIIQCFCVGVKPGVGGPYFLRIQRSIASLVFSIPSFYGLEFGAGFSLASMYGSESNDSLYVDDNGKVKTTTNNSGGLNGGITNGMPICFSVCVRPTPSIGREQNTINYKDLTNTKISIQGRHDPCIVKRAVVVVESVCALSILDEIL